MSFHPRGGSVQGSKHFARDYYRRLLQEMFHESMRREIAPIDDVKNARGRFGVSRQGNGRA